MRAQQLNDEASDKVLQIEVEYNQKRLPIHRERSKYFRRLPEFWLTVLTQQETLRELIAEEDEDALRYIDEVRMSPLPGSHHAKRVYLRPATLTLRAPSAAC